ncbi:PNK3P and AAA 33 domain containing protein-like protein, partial [Leptotrombidium deliense]
WRLIDTKIVQRIRDFTKRNYRFVIFSNQAGISSGASPLKSVQKRFEDAIKRINIPCIAMLATKDDIYRKPRPGMFWVYQNSFNDAVEISEKFMIGDAAGRKSSIKKDHSAVDILFAYNVKFDSFQTPEDFVASKPMQSSVQDAMTLYSTNLPSFRPQSLNENNKFVACNDSGEYFKSIQELLESLPSKAILFVGLPGSGKSYFFNNHLSKHGYKEVSRDRLGSMDKCEQHIKKLISEGETKIVVNNLNLEENGRRKFLQLLPGLVCFYFHSTRSQCLHLNNYRRLMRQMNADYEYAPVPEPVIYANEKKLNEPTKDEGFSSVYRISFIVGDFDSEQQQQLFFMYL